MEFLGLQECTIQYDSIDTDSATRGTAPSMNGEKKRKDGEEDVSFEVERKWREKETNGGLEEALESKERDIEELQRRLLAERLVHTVQLRAIEELREDRSLMEAIKPEDDEGYLYEELIALKDASKIYYNKLLEVEKIQDEREDEHDKCIHRLKVELEEKEAEHAREKQLLLDELEEFKDNMATLRKEKEGLARKSKEERERLKKEYLTNIQKLKDEIKESNLASEQRHIEDTNTLQALHTHLHDVQQERDKLQGALLTLHQTVSSLLPLNINNSTLTPPATEWTSPIHLSDGMTTPISHTYKSITSNNGDSGLEDSHQKNVTTATIKDEAPPINYAHANNDDDDNLTILSINSSSDVPAIWDLETASPNLQSIQDVIPHLYQSVSHLVNSFLSSSTQAIQYQNELMQAQEELSKSETNLSAQLNTITELEEQIRSLEAQLTSKVITEEDLKSAQEKISSLIKEIELTRKQNEENAKKEKEEEKAKLIEKERNTLNNQVKLLQKELLLLQKERGAQRDVIKSLQEKLESFESDSRKEIERLRSSETKITKELRERATRIHELECLPEQLVSQQQKNEELQETNDLLNKELTKAQHAIATMQSAEHLQSQLEANRFQLLKEKEKYEELKKTTEENEAALREVTAELERGEESREKAKKELLEANAELEVKEEELEKLLAIRNEAQEQCDHLNTQIETLNSQVESLSVGLKSSNEQVSKLCQNMEEKEREVSLLVAEKDSHIAHLEEMKTESDKHLKAFENSAVQLQSAREQVNALKSNLKSCEEQLHSLTISKASVEEEIKVLRKQVSESEEFRQLESQHLRSEFASKEQEMKSLYEQQTKKLEAEHAGQIAYLKIEIKELTDKVNGVGGMVNDKMLQRIADITPVLEKDANEVLQLCSDENSDIKKANGIIGGLKERVTELQKELSLAETSLLSANETLTNLKTELVVSHERVSVLEKQLSEQATQLGQALAEREKEFKESLAKETQKGKKKHDQLTKKYNKLLKTQQSLKESSINRERELSEAYQLLQDQLREATSDAIKSNRELEDNKALAQKLLEQLEAMKGVKSNSDITYKQQLDTLRQALEQKENKLSEITNDFLEEKLRVAQMRGENSSLLSRINSPEKTNPFSINRQKSEDILEEEKTSLRSALQSSQAEIHRLSGLLTRRDNRVKSLIFQKRYLINELDAYFHTSQAALLMIQDMGGVPWEPPHLRHRKKKNGKTFKRFGILVCCVVRLRRLGRRRHSHRINGYIPVASQIKPSK